jgi:glucuronate isomerase
MEELMNTFIHEDFLLNSKTAKTLFHTYAEKQPILDYHCHLSPKDIAQNRRFENLFDIWLEGDHYKWRAMRTHGVDERFCTGNAAPFEKFAAWANTVPHTLRNPLYHWTHLELKRYFGITELLDQSTAKTIWEEANAKLATEDLSAQGILNKFNVRALCTTDDPSDDLRYHKQIAESDLATKVYPTFRPDKALTVHLPESFNTWVAQLSETSQVAIRNLSTFLQALEQRHEYFHQLGARVSDHGLDSCIASFCTESVASAIFDKVRGGVAATKTEHEQFASFMMLFFGQLDASKGWTSQLHLGALRNTNTKRFRQLGPDVGFDSISDRSQVEALRSYLDRLDEENALPKTILYNLNPADNYAFATMVGNFQDGSVAGKVQFGSGWWFLDQKEAMTWQMNALSSVGLLSHFVGMVTDSRSFMSYPRHEYFRRVLCDLLGADIERGEIPNDQAAVGAMIQNICFDNAKNYLGLQTADVPTKELIAAF